MIQSSRPVAAVVALNNRLPPGRRKNPCGEDDAVPAAISASSDVPAPVPSVTQSSVPVVPCVAENTVRPFGAAAKLDGAPPFPTVSPPETTVPGFMSASIDVPAAVPSVIQSSDPLVPSLARNSARPGAIEKNEPGTLDPGTSEPKDGGRVRMSRNSEVPAAVPSVTHNSVPAILLFAENNIRPLPRSKNPVAPLVLVPAKMSDKSKVPASVPSVIQGSVPVNPLLALKIIVFGTTCPPTRLWGACGIDSEYATYHILGSERNLVSRINLRRRFESLF